MPDIVITEPIASLRAKLRLAVELDPLAEAHQAEGPLEPQEKIW